jgi:hypothetical protein
VVFLQAPGGFVLTAEGRQDIADGPITRTVDIQQPVQIPCYGDAVAQLFGDCRIRIGGQQYPKVAGGLSLGVTADFFPGAAGNGLNVLLSGKCNDPASARELTHLNPSRL